MPTKIKKNIASEKIYRGTGNVFKDLGFQNPEEYKVKADLAIQISKIIKSRNFSQIQAAKIIKASQPDISKLKSGQLTGFTIDRLVSFLILLNKNIEIRISEGKNGKIGKLGAKVI